MNRRSVLVSITLVLATPIAAVRAQGTTEDRAAIRHVIGEYRTAVDRIDMAAMRAIHPPDALIVDAGVVSLDRDAFLKALQIDLGGGSRGFTFTAMEIVDIRFTGPTSAVALVNWDASTPRTSVIRGIWLVVLGKHKADWLIDAWHSTSRK